MFNERLEAGTEKEFIEKNHNVVEWFLFSHHLNRSEYYDVVIFAYLDAVSDYWSDSALQRKYKFSTVANRRMWFAYCKEKRHEMRSVRYPRPICIDILDQSGYVPAYTRYPANPQDQLIVKDTISRLLPYITEKELEVVQLRAQGYRDSEIAGKCGVSRNGISSRIHRMRKRLRKNAVAV